MRLEIRPLTRMVVCGSLTVTALMGTRTQLLARVDSDSKVATVPRDANVYGNSLGEWGARYWQLVTAIPASRNPAMDTTGAYCGEGQQGPVWILGSTFGGDPVVRSCTVPAGTALFFPVATVIGGAGAFDCEPTTPGVACNLASLRTAVAAATDAVTLEVTVDGIPIRHLRDQRLQTPAFTLTYPADNVLGAPAGTNSPNVADGYWVMLEPLRIGAHALHSRGEFTGGVFAGVIIEATYHLTVEP